MSRLPAAAWIVSHTHWDREWYWTLPRFRVRLADVIDQVLERLEEDGPFRHFVLDGQALVVEDYLAMRPEAEPRVRQLASTGALSLGPWYVLADGFLVSGEATVRNLLWGHRTAARWGAPQKVGYVPDSFGHIAQLPQILNRAGLDSFIYTRGNGDEIDELGWEFDWQAPDGSTVLAINQCGGYCNAGGLGYEELWHAHTRRQVEPKRAVQQVGDLFARMAERSGSEVVLLNNGCDHFPPQPAFPEILAALRQAFPEVNFHHGSLEEFVADLRSRGSRRRCWQGELAGGRLHPILSGVWSARMPLKQHNDRCQTWLADVAEPLAAAAMAAHGQAYPQGELNAAWRMLLQNHPHDSICGCSIDAVHRQMESRFMEVEETAAQVVRDRLTDRAPTFAARQEDDRHTVLMVANPLPRRRRETIRRLIVLQPFAGDPASLRLFDQAGRAVPFVLLDHWYVERFWGVDYRTLLEADEQMELFSGYLDTFASRMVRDAGRRGDSDLVLLVEFQARDLPPVGHAFYRLQEVPPGTASAGDTQMTALQEMPHPVRVGESTLDNGLVRVQAYPDGTFDLTDLRNGHTFKGLNLLEDTEDRGDEYDHGACAEPHAVGTVAAPDGIAATGHGGLSGCLTMSPGLELPVSLAGDRTRRTGETVPCPLQVAISLHADSPLVRLRLLLDNRARDHRLRVAFPSGLPATGFVTDNPFLLQQRSPESPSGEGWAQEPVATRSQQEFSMVTHEGAGLALFNRGLPEIAGSRAADGGLTLNLTLLRAVGWLSRDDFPERHNTNAGPTLATPEAQCPGRHRFDYAVMPFSGDAVEADVKGWSRLYRVPPLAVQGVAAEQQHDGGLLELADARVSITAIKRHQDRDTLVVRLYNLTGSALQARLQVALPLSQAWLCDLLEERRQPLDRVASRTLEVPLGPHAIVTCELVPG